MFLRTFVTAAVVVAGTFATAPAFAQSPTEVVSPDGKLVTSLQVSYADLNLDSAAGRITLENRIRGAAIAVCRNQYSMREEAACRSKARAQGAQRIAMIVDPNKPTQVAMLDRR